MRIGDLVRYWDEGWHFGILLQQGRKWARVQHPMRGKVWVAVGDVAMIPADW